MNRSRYLFVAMAALVAGAQIVRAQQPVDNNRRNNHPVVDGAVESLGGRLQVSLTNTDSVREIRGAARISLGAPDRHSEVARFEFTLAPQESRLFSLDSRGDVGDQYTLSIHERAGALILLKNAPIKRGADATPIMVTPPAPTPPVPAATAPAVAKGLTVKARLAAGRPSQSRGAETQAPTAGRQSQPQVGEPAMLAPEQPSEPQVAVIKKPSAKRARRGKSSEINPLAVERPSPLPIGEIEAPFSDEPASIVLAFEIIAPAPIINASLSVSANGFKERQAITIQGSASAEFKLPDDFIEPKINYTLTDASGKTLITGEFDLEALRMEDSVRISEIKFDQTSYAPGQSAHIVVTLEGRSPFGYLLEVAAEDENGSPLLNDSRRGVYNKGKSMQEFRVEIPAEAKAIVAVEFKAFGNLTKKLFDSGSRDIIINNVQNDKTDNPR